MFCFSVKYFAILASLRGVQGGGIGMPAKPFSFSKWKPPKNHNSQIWQAVCAQNSDEYSVVTGSWNAISVLVPLYVEEAISCREQDLLTPTKTSNTILCRFTQMKSNCSAGTYSQGPYIELQPKCTLSLSEVTAVCFSCA